jgi:hypothetical protein
MTKRNPERILDVRKDLHELWAYALDSYLEYRDATGILDLLAAGAEVPDWVRSELAKCRDGERPPAPNLSERDQQLLPGERKYRAMPDKRHGGLPSAERFKEAAKDLPLINPEALERFVYGSADTPRRVKGGLEARELSRKQQERDWLEQAARRRARRPSK